MLWFVLRVSWTFLLEKSMSFQSFPMQSYIFSLDFLGFEVENCCFLSHSLYFFGDAHIWQVEISEKNRNRLIFLLSE